MELSAKTLRSVEFRSALRGYHHEDVDEFLERVAVGVDTLQERLRAASERAAKAEARLLEQTEADEQLRTALLMAQRTAEQALEEARSQAAQMVAAADAQASAVLSDAEERAKVHQSNLEVILRAEIEQLQAAREQLTKDVAALQGYVDEQRSRLRDTLGSALEALDRGLPPLPSTPATTDVLIPPVRPRPTASATDPTGGYAAVPADPPAPTVVSMPAVPVVEPEPAVTGEADSADPASDPAGEHAQYLAELRAAAADRSPLGPVDEADTAANEDKRDDAMDDAMDDATDDGSLDGDGDGAEGSGGSPATRGHGRPVRSGGRLRRRR